VDIHTFSLAGLCPLRLAQPTIGRPKDTTLISRKLRNPSLGILSLLHRYSESMRRLIKCWSHVPEPGHRFEHIPAS
jgi:hypothetical protein